MASNPSSGARLVRHRPLGELGQVEEVAPSMGRASDFDDRRGLAAIGVKSVSAGKGVGLHDSRPGDEDYAPMLAMTGRRMIEQRHRRSLAAERPVVAHVDPKAPVGVLPWRAPSRSCRQHASLRRRAPAGEARGSDRERRRIRRPSRRCRTSCSLPSQRRCALPIQPRLVTKLADQDHGEPARAAMPRGIGFEGAGGPETLSQSRQANFSRTRS